MFSNANLMQRTRTAPTGYERVRMLFHAIRTVQLLSSMIVGSIVIFFAWWLVHDGYKILWTFILLLITTFTTVICLTVTIMFHCLTGLSPRVNLLFNSIMLFLWSLGFSMLTYWCWGTLTHMCKKDLWQNEDGVMVCRSYKALFTFALLGLSSTIAAVILDVHIRRLQTRFGQHVRLDNLDQKPSRTVVDVRGPYADADNARSVNDLNDYPSRNSDAFEVPHVGYGAHVAPQQDKSLLHKDSELGFDTRDTGYHGGHAERVFGAI